jgi:hypothetical protein
VGKHGFPRASSDLSLGDSLHENGHYSLMGSQNNELFIGGESRLDYISVHMHHSW